MDYQGFIEIFGTPRSYVTKDQIEELINAITKECTLDWDGNLDAKEAIELIQSADGDEPLSLTSQGYGLPFTSLKDICQKLGLSYVAHVSFDGDEDYLWADCLQSGSDPKTVYFIGAKSGHTDDEIEAAAKKGLEAVLELVNENRLNLRVGKLTLDENFRQLLSAYSEDDEYVYDEDEDEEVTNTFSM